MAPFQMETSLRFEPSRDFFESCSRYSTIIDECLAGNMLFETLLQMARIKTYSKPWSKLRKVSDIG